jgi:curved DNA-binding protein CbpA
VTDDYDLYAVLEVAPHARPAVIDAAFGVLRESAARDMGDGAARTLALLNRAHAILADGVRRAAYDRDRSR